MNLNYENLSLEGISSEVKEKYAFPNDKDFLLKYMKGGVSLLSKSEKKAEYNKNTTISVLFIVSLAMGGISYLSLVSPNGKVLRDAFDATLPTWRRVTRRVVPFTLLTMPFFYARRVLLDSKNFDYKS